MKFLKWQLLVIVSLILVLSACGNDETETNDSEAYNKGDFELTLPSTTGEQVSLVPNGKTLYAYFTGIG